MPEEQWALQGLQDLPIFVLCVFCRGVDGDRHIMAYLLAMSMHICMSETSWMLLQTRVRSFEMFRILSW